MVIPGAIPLIASRLIQCRPAPGWRSVNPRRPSRRAGASRVAASGGRADLGRLDTGHRDQRMRRGATASKDVARKSRSRRGKGGSLLALRQEWAGPFHPALETLSTD